MEVTRQMVQQIAELARLECSEGEVLRMQEDLQQILSYMECLEEINTEESVEAAVCTEQLRADEVCPSMPVEQLLAVSPSGQGYWTPEER